MYKAFHDHVPRMATPEMTAELETRHGQDRRRRDLQGRGAHGSAARCCTRPPPTLEDQREEFAKQIWAGMDEDKFLGPCKVCEEAGRKREDGGPNRLRIIDLKGGKRMYGCEGWINRDDPEPPRLVPGQRTAARPRLRALAAGGALLGLRRAPAADGQGLPRAALEALPQRRLPDDGRDAREARRAPGARRRRARRRRRPRNGEPRRRRRPREAADAAAPAKRRRRRRGRRGAQDAARRRPARDQARALRHQADAPAARVHHPRGHRPLREDHPGGAARRGARRRRCCCASPAAPRRASGCASCSRIPARARAAAPSCCSSAPPGRSCSRRVIAPGARRGPDVVCDRFIDSTVAYQGVARGLGVEFVEQRERARGRRLPARPARCCCGSTRRLAGARARATARTASRPRASSSSGRSRRAYDELAERHRTGSRWSTPPATPTRSHARIMRAVGGATADERRVAERAARRSRAATADAASAARSALAAASAGPFTPTCSSGRPARASARRRGRSRRSCSPTARRDPDDARRRALADPSPHPDLVWLRPPGHPAPGRGGPRAGDRRGRLPAVRGRAPRLRDRGRRRDGRGEPERPAEDARGAAAVRAPDPGQRRARGAAGDGPLALPRGPLRAGSAPRRSRRGSPTTPAGAGAHRRRAARRRRRRRGPASCSTTSGRALREAAEELVPRRRARASSRARRGRRSLERRRGGRRASLAEAARARREADEQARPSAVRTGRPPPRPGGRGGGASARWRRARTATLDLGLALLGAWMRDLAAVAEGARRARAQLRPDRRARSALADGLDARRARRARRARARHPPPPEVNVSRGRWRSRRSCFRLEFLLARR